MHGSWLGFKVRTIPFSTYSFFAKLWHLSCKNHKNVWWWCLKRTFSVALGNILKHFYFSWNHQYSLSSDRNAWENKIGSKQSHEYCQRRYRCRWYGRRYRWKKKTLPLTLHVAPSTPTQNFLNCEKALQRWAYKKMKIFIISIFKMTSPLVDKALPPEMTVTFIHFEEKWSRTEKIISSYWVTETSQSEE